MAKKQVRIDLHNLGEILKEKPRAFLHFTMKNGAVFVGSIHQLRDDLVIILNTRNQRFKINKDQIRVIWGDEKIAAK